MTWAELRAFLLAGALAWALGWWLGAPIPPPCAYRCRVVEDAHGVPSYRLHRMTASCAGPARPSWADVPGGLVCRLGGGPVRAQGPLPTPPVTLPPRPASRLFRFVLRSDA